MKIVLTVHQFFPEFSAGSEVLTYETAKELQRRGHDVEVWAGFPADAATSKEKPIEQYEYDGLKVYRYNHCHYIPRVIKNVMEHEYNNLLFKGHFRDYLARSRPDMVHFFHLYRFSGSAIDVCESENVPAVFTPTDFWIICMLSQLRLPDNKLCLGPDGQSLNCIRHIAKVSMGFKHADVVPDNIYKFFIRMAGKKLWPMKYYSALLDALSKRKDFFINRLNKLEMVLVPTRFMEKMFIQNGHNPAVFKFLPYGLNLKPFEKGNTKTGTDRIRLGFIGTLLEHKGAHVLLEALRLVPEVSIDVKIYGKLEESAAYASKLKALAGDDQRIKFCGAFPNSQIAEVFSELDVLVVPSIWYENTPLVIYSAFASGTPVIATNLGGMSEVVHHEVNGLLFEKGDAKGLSLLLKRIVEDKTLLERLSKNVAPPPSISDYVDGLEGVYKDVLAKRRKK